MDIDGDNYMWLDGTRHCRLLRATQSRETNCASFRSRGVGEFCLEIYYVPTDAAPRLLWRDDFILK